MTNSYSALCLLIKDENDYLEEWLNYHRSIGIGHFYIYDNMSKIPIENQGDVTVIRWELEEIGKQTKAYLDCAKNNEHRWIGFIDTDEFIINNDINSFLKQYEEHDAVGIHWICYGDSQLPSNDKRPCYPHDFYIKRSLKTEDINKHIKSFVNPKKLLKEPLDPHLLVEDTVNEEFIKITSPLSYHTSETIFIKHLITRTKDEYLEKINRGRGDGVPTGHNLETFNLLNTICNIHTTI